MRFSREEIESKFLSCVTNRSLNGGFDIFWAVLIYCSLYKTTIQKARPFFREFSTKALHMGYNDISSPIHHACFCKYCTIRDHCFAILMERKQFSGPDGYYPSTIESIDE